MPYRSVSARVLVGIATMPVVPTLDTDGQLLAGLETWLRETYAGWVYPDNITDAFPTPDVVEGHLAQAEAHGLSDPTIHILIGDSVPSRQARSQQPRAFHPRGGADPSVPTLVEAGRDDTAVTVIIVTGGRGAPEGIAGKTLRGILVDMLTQQLDGPITLFLPDCMETFDVVDPRNSIYNLDAVVTYARKRRDDRQSRRSLWRYDVNLTVTHGRAYRFADQAGVVGAITVTTGGGTTAGGGGTTIQTQPGAIIQRVITTTDVQLERAAPDFVSQTIVPS